MTQRTKVNPLLVIKNHSKSDQCNKECGFLISASTILIVTLVKFNQTACASHRFIHWYVILVMDIEVRSSGKELGILWNRSSLIKTIEPYNFT